MPSDVLTLVLPNGSVVKMRPTSNPEVIGIDLMDQRKNSISGYTSADTFEVVRKWLPKESGR